MFLVFWTLNPKRTNFVLIRAIRDGFNPLEEALSYCYKLSYCCER